MSKSILFSVIGANDLNSFGDFQQNNLRSYVFHCLSSDIELLEGEREFTNALELGLKIDFPIVVNEVNEITEEKILSTISECSNCNFPEDDQRLTEIIGMMNIDDSIIFYSDRESVPSDVERCIVVPEIDTDDWIKFVNGERHKFMLFKRRWNNWESGKYLYVWAIAIDTLGNKENQLEVFDIDKKSHFPIGLIVDQDLLNILSDPETILFDFSFDLLSSQGVEPEIYNPIMLKNMKGISLGKKLQYEISLPDKLSLLFCLNDLNISEKTCLFSFANESENLISVSIDESGNFYLKIKETEVLVENVFDFVQENFIGLIFKEDIHVLVNDVIVGKFPSVLLEEVVSKLIVNEWTQDYGYLKYFFILKTTAIDYLKSYVSMLKQDDLNYIAKRKAGKVFGMQDNLFTVLSRDHANQLSLNEDDFYFNSGNEVPLWER